MTPTSLHFSPSCGSLCSHTPAIGFGQALTRVLQFSAVLAAEDQKVCSTIHNILPLAHYEYIYLAAPKITTHSLGENGGRVLHIICDPQTYTLERQPKGRGKGVWLVLN